MFVSLNCYSLCILDLYGITEHTHNINIIHMLCVETKVCTHEEWKWINTSESKTIDLLMYISIDDATTIGIDNYPS